MKPVQEMSTDELKSLGYDILQQRAQCDMNLSVISQELQRREQEQDTKKSK